ncbi:MAG TPA: glycosyltransferase family 1 protein [Archaeoglobus sp.]|nr:glycosyltransferase family 1 protein [Archaeoglobus sp.]
MKVVMTAIRVYPFHKYGGAEIYIYNLAKYLVKNGIDVKIITSTPKPKVESTVYDGIKYEFVPPHVTTDTKRSVISYHLFNFNLARKLCKEDFDILHSFGMTAHNYLKKCKKIGKVIVEPFGLYGTHEVKQNFAKKCLRKLLIEKPLEYCVKNADAIAVEGNIQAKEISEKFEVSEDKFIYIPDGVEIEFIEESIKKSEVSKEDLGIGDADIVLVNVNRLVKNKGVIYLIDALGILNKCLDVRLILIGSGPEENRIKMRLKELGIEQKVLHFRNIPDEKKFQLISLADISVTPTLFEGLPIVILEAMACGKPVIASNVTEVPQVVNHGVNGFLVPPRDPEAIAKAVLEIYKNDLIEKMGRESKKIARNYDWDIIAKMAIRKYEELMEKNNTATI